MPKVNVPGLGVIEFPDGTSKDEMQRAIKRKLDDMPEMEPAGTLGSFGLGAARTGGRLSAGAQDIYNLGMTFGAGEAGVPDSEYRQARESIKADEAVAESVYKARTSEHPLARFLGESAPYMVAPVGGTAARAAVIGAGLGGLTYNPDPTARAMQAGAGLTGGVVGQRLNRLIPDMPLGTPEARAAQQLGLQLPPGQAFDNRLLQRLELPMKSTPLLAGRFDAMNNANQAVFNRMVAREVGLGDVTKIRPQDYGRAWRSVSKEFNRLTEKVSVKIDDQLLDDLGRIEQEQLSSIVRNDPLEPVMKRLINNLSDDAMSGDQFQKYAHELGNKAHTQITSQAGDRDFGLALYQIKEALDDAMERSMGAVTRKRYQEARGKWRILKALEARGALHERGDVSANTLAGYFGRTDKAGYKRGGNVEDMYESLRAARRFSDMVGSSGTAERSSLNPLIAAGAGLAYDPATTGMGLGALAAFAQTYPRLTRLPNITLGQMAGTGRGGLIAATNNITRNYELERARINQRTGLFDPQPRGLMGSYGSPAGPYPQQQVSSGPTFNSGTNMNGSANGGGYNPLAPPPVPNGGWVGNGN